QWITERSRRGRKRQLCAERCDIHKSIVENPDSPRVVENSNAAANTALSITEHVISKTNAWREKVQAARRAVWRHTRIAWEKQSKRSIGKYSRLLACVKVIQPELFNPAFSFAPGQRGLPAESGIQ